MTIAVQSITLEEIALIPAWAANIRAGQFTSRLYPRPFDPAAPELPDPQLVAWYAIRCDDRAVGHVWIERETVEKDLAVLGILIGETELFGKGLGRAAIRFAVDDVLKRWPLRTIRLSVRKDNPRGIACYQHSGFAIVGEAVKEIPGAPPAPHFVMDLQGIGD